MAHSRRKLSDAPKSSKKPGIANKGLKYIQKLYRLEEECRGWFAERRYDLRQQKAKPILGEFRAFIDESIGTTPDSGLTGKALHYAVNEWQSLEDLEQLLPSSTGKLFAREEASYSQIK
jgi:transposase